ncbi:MAG: STAS domain-containing protein [Bacteroidales bacterium]|nr:STAS domain-containing protein [Bacteroidales bacterium]
MKTTITEKDGRVVLAVEGELDTDTCPQFKEDIQPLLDQAPKALEVDMQALEYISSKALRILISLQQAVVANKGAFKVTNVQPAVREVFDMTGLAASMIQD